MRRRHPHRPPNAEAARPPQARGDGRARGEPGVSTRAASPSASRATAATSASSTRCARSACAGSARPVERRATRRRSAACSTRSVISSRWTKPMSEPSREPQRDRPAQPQARARLAQGRASASDAARARAPARPPVAARRADGSRSGAKDRARFEGGQNPIHMRMRKLRGPHMKKSMPFEPFRTHTQPVNLLDLEARFESGDCGHPRGAAGARASRRARASRSRSSPRAS